jgi:hypothetical protein
MNDEYRARLSHAVCHFFKNPSVSRGECFEYYRLIRLIRFAACEDTAFSYFTAAAQRRGEPLIARDLIGVRIVRISRISTDFFSSTIRIYPRHPRSHYESQGCIEKLQHPAPSWNKSVHNQ